MNKEILNKVVSENVDVLLKKNRDYGSDNLLMTGLPGIATRLQDKVSRLRHLSASGDEANFESLWDTLQDISNYGIIGQLMESGDLRARPSMVYLAGPIDDVEREQSWAWRRTVASILASFGISCYNPAQAFVVANPDPIARRVIEVNREAIRRSDMVLANLIGPGRAIGTIREIEYAVNHGVPVVAVINNSDGLLSLHDVKSFPKMDDALSYITGREIDLSKIQCYELVD